MENKNKTHENGNNTAKRGFASMPHEKVEEIARKGGKAGGHASGESKKGHKEEKE